MNPFDALLMFLFIQHALMTRCAKPRNSTIRGNNEFLQTWSDYFFIITINTELLLNVLLNYHCISVYYFLFDSGEQCKH